MLTALVAHEQRVAGFLVGAVMIVAVLAAASLLATGRAIRAERPLPRELLVLTGAGVQIVVVLALALVALQALVEIVAVAVAP